MHTQPDQDNQEVPLRGGFIQLALRCAQRLASLTALSFVSCERPPELSSSPSPPPAPIPLPDPSCVGYFGQPNEQSGLAEAQCDTSCLCDQRRRAWAGAPLSDPLFGFSYVNEPEALSEDPYGAEETAPPLEGVACVIEVDRAEMSYRLETRSLEAAPPDRITHLGPCGACSSMRDLQVYLENIDLTDPVRACGLQSISSGQEEGVSCLRALGFSEACSAIWYFNTVNTRTKCLQLCFAHLDSPYVDEDGALNPCLACDEEESGPIFKAYAGRTRRNSGLPSAICRPCSSVSPVSHAYLSSAPPN